RDGLPFGTGQGYHADCQAVQSRLHPEGELMTSRYSHARAQAKRANAFLLASILILTLAISVKADEGMWLFNQPPVEQLKKKYHFDATRDWLEHVQQSSIRFNNGGSGSFISADGLIMTNHHVGTDCIQKLST